MKLICLQGAFEQFNYMGSTDDFEKVWDEINFELYNKKQEIFFTLPISILSISALQNNINLIYGLRQIYSLDKQWINFSFVLEVEPFLDIKILPKKHVDMLEYTWSFMLKKLCSDQNNFIGFASDELDSLQKIIDYMQITQTEPDYIADQQRLFYKKILEYDFKNNKNFCAIFPDMIEFYNYCENL